MRRLVFPFLVTLVLAGLTSGLGVWQIHRLAWKTSLLARMDAVERSPAVPLPSRPGAFQKVIARGRLDPRAAVAYEDDVRDDAQGNAVMGTHLVEPLLRDGQPPLLVDLGWVKYPPAPEGGTVSITGYIRPAEHPNWLSASDDPHGRRFYTLDPARIAAGIGLSAPLPYTLVALGPPATPDPARSLPRPPNDHLEYAVTWFSLSLVSIAMFLLWARGMRRGS